MQAVILRHLEVNVSGTLIEGHVSERSSRKSVERIRIARRSGANQIGGRDQLQKVLNRGRSNRRAVVHARDGAGNCQALVLPQSFVRQEKEELVLQNRAAEVRAKIVS